jgi:hypothetical protein
MAKRVSLTKTQRTAGIGAELLALCQSVTDDGSISKDEVLALMRWLKDNRDADLPAIAFLAQTVEQIIADRKVTKEERAELYKAIELVLPPDARKDAVAARKELEAEQRHRDKLDRDAQRQRDREFKQKAEPLFTHDFMVAGVHYEGRDQIVRQYVEEHAQVFLRRDPSNRHSRFATEICLANGLQIGFVPEDDAQDIAPHLDRGCPHFAYIKKVLTGGRVPIPVVVSAVYNPDTTETVVVFPQQVPGRATLATPNPNVSDAVRAARAKSEAGCGLVLSILACTAAMLYLLIA